MLTVVDRVSVPAHPFDLVDEGVHGGDGPFRAGPHTGVLQQFPHPCLREPGRDRLAQRGGVQRVPGAPRRGEPDTVPALDDVDVDDVVAVEDREGGRLLELVPQSLQPRVRAFPEDLQLPRLHADETESQPVQPGVAVPFDVAVGLQCPQIAECGRFGQIGRLADIDQGHTVDRLLQEVENRTDALDRADRVIPFFAGHHGLVPGPISLIAPSRHADAPLWNTDRLLTKKPIRSGPFRAGGHEVAGVRPVPRCRGIDGEHPRSGAAGCAVRSPL